MDYVIPSNFYEFGLGWYQGIDFRNEANLLLDVINQSKKENDIQNYIKEKKKWFIPASIFKNYDFGHHEAYIVPEQELGEKYRIGDSVMVYPDKKIGIVCQGVNEKGVLRVQLLGKKIWINHKRVKLHVAASKLYPEDYDFSIIFDTVENRKIRHDMDRKYTEEVIITEDTTWEKRKK